VSFNANETLDAVMEPLTAIIDTICLVIERTPPELLVDIYKNGIVLTGGGSKLTGLDKLIEKTTGIRTYVAKDPISCVALGTGKSLENLEGGVKGFLGGFGNN
jgi:rod shape-determining protein MreB